MATNQPQDDYHRMGMRLPRDLHQRLHDAAAESGRSLNGEIVARLQASFEAGPGSQAAVTMARLQFERTEVEVESLARRLATLEFIAAVHALLDELKRTNPAAEKWEAVERVQFAALGASADDDIDEVRALLEAASKEEWSQHAIWRELLMKAMETTRGVRRTKPRDPSKPDLE